MIQVLRTRITHLNMVDMLTLNGEEDLAVDVVDFVAGRPWVALGEGKYVVCYLLYINNALILLLLRATSTFFVPSVL